jgi:hypothetical protein
MVDQLLKLKRDNSRTMNELDYFYDEWSNFLCKKNIKWSSFVYDEPERQYAVKS